MGTQNQEGRVLVNCSDCMRPTDCKRAKRHDLLIDLCDRCTGKLLDQMEEDRLDELAFEEFIDREELVARYRDEEDNYPDY